MNNDYSKRVLIQTDDVVWEKTSDVKVSKKLLSRQDMGETALVKLEENSRLNVESKMNNVEIFVLDGTYINEFGEFREGTYLRLSKEDGSLVRSITGCTIFRKTNSFQDESDVIINTHMSSWIQGQGNLEVIPLFSQTALVKWPKNEKFIPHRHWGGEEILVLKGIFMDEHGIYPKGTWIRSPHLSEHYPFVQDETIIFVKTGHL